MKDVLIMEKSMIDKEFLDRKNLKVIWIRHSEGSDNISYDLSKEDSDRLIELAKLGLEYEKEFA